MEANEEAEGRVCIVRVVRHGKYVVYCRGEP